VFQEINSLLAGGEQLGLEVYEVNTRPRSLMIGLLAQSLAQPVCEQVLE
jgi:hypothetical protein